MGRVACLLTFPAVLNLSSPFLISNFLKKLQSFVMFIQPKLCSVRNFRYLYALFFADGFTIPIIYTRHGVLVFKSENNGRFVLCLMLDMFSFFIESCQAYFIFCLASCPTEGGILNYQVGLSFSLAVLVLFCLLSQFKPCTSYRIMLVRNVYQISAKIARILFMVLCPNAASMPESDSPPRSFLKVYYYSSLYG